VQAEPRKVTNVNNREFRPAFRPVLCRAGRGYLRPGTRATSDPQFDLPMRKATSAVSWTSGPAGQARNRSRVRVVPHGAPTMKLERSEYDGDVLAVAIDPRDPRRWDLVAALAEDLDRGTRRIVLDLGGHRYLTSVRIAAILRLRNHVLELGGSVGIAGLDPQLRQIFRAYHLEGCFRLDRDLPAAVAAARR